MKLRTKTIITVILFSLLIFAALQGVKWCVLKPSFTNIEHEETMQNIDQAMHMLNYTISGLEVKVGDYAFWDDTYNFVQDKNEAYLMSDFCDSTFENLGLNLAVIVDNQTNLLYCQSFDLNASTMIETSNETINTLVSNSNFWAFQSTKSMVAGLMVIDNKPMLVAAAPILTSEYQGPIMGGLLFGKYLDQQLIGELTTLVDFNFNLSTISDFQLLKGNKQVATSLLSNIYVVDVKEKSPDIIAGYIIINDVNSNPEFILEINQARIVYQESVLVGNVFLVAAIFITVFVGLSLYILLKREIVKPMSKLAEYVGEISLNPNFEPPAAPLHSSEEVAVVSNAVRDTLNRKLEGMNEVSRMVAHDLRNPLAGIRNATYFIKKKYGSGMEKTGLEMLKTIDDCVTYSDRIVENLMEYSGEITLDKITTTPRKLVDNVLSRLIIPSNITVINEANDNLSITVDTEKIERVFTNLITNGIDAMQTGGTLRITSKNVQGSIQIDVSDKGTGMSKELLEKIWTPFFTTKAKGMGVGLSICKRIVDAHHGKIKVQSVEGKGSTFSVFLPAAK